MITKIGKNVLVIPSDDFVRAIDRKKVDLTAGKYQIVKFGQDTSLELFTEVLETNCFEFGIVFCTNENKNKTIIPFDECIDFESIPVNFLLPIQSCALIEEAIGEYLLSIFKVLTIKCVNECGSGSSKWEICMEFENSEEYYSEVPYSKLLKYLVIE